MNVPPASPIGDCSGDATGDVAGLHNEATAVRWFAEDVYPHGPLLKAYLRASFPAAGDVDDVVQESYLRLWKARAAHPIKSAKAFLFTVARRLALDLHRRSCSSPIEVFPTPEAARVLSDRADVAESACVNEESAMLTQAIDALPPRCREIIILRKFHNLPQREVAAKLGLSELTVQEQVYRGLRRMEKFLVKNGMIRRW